jgi:uncharacterized membrane protein YphA (DoxX/SURF4 family)
MRLLRNVSRYIIAVVFIFSGFVKAIDPLGSMYKFNDYFDAFHMDFLNNLSLVLAILLSSTEIVIGLCLFLKIKMKEVAWALFIFMGAFTVLTLILALTNPVSDCGCFGDALILTNWQTFYKNLIFLVPTLVVFFERNRFRHSFKPAAEWVLTGGLFVIAVILSVFSLANLPMMDFRPYHVGANIPAGMEIPEGMPLDQYETILVYEKEGVQKEFSLDAPEQPWNDSSWTWVETQNKLVSKGYEPPIHDFSLTSSEGIDYTDQLLADEGYSLLIVAHDLEKMNESGLERVNRFVARTIENGFKAYGMSASLPEVVMSIEETYQPPYSFHTTDDITLKTMIRSNPGVMLIKEGTILAKWHHRNIPDEDFFSEQSLSYALSDQNRIKKDYLSLVVMLVIALLGVVVYLFRRI